MQITNESTQTLTAPEPEYILSINKTMPDGELRPIATLLPNLTFTFGEGYVPNEAAKIFWDAIQFEGETLRQRNQELTETLAYWIAQAQHHHEAFMLADSDRVNLATELMRMRNEE